MSIPKVIHYCWFGGGEKSDKIKMCMRSWKKFCPDYRIIEWNESNFDIHCCKWVEQAYQHKKWAFVTDYVRLFVLYNCGGVYMDTDVEIIKPIDGFLGNNAFSGFEQTNTIPTAIMGAEKGNPWIKFLLDYYEGKEFVSDGIFSTTTNVIIITEMTKKKYNIQLNNEYIDIPGHFTLYPKEYFCPKGYITGLTDKTDNTVCIHHFESSWMGKEQLKKVHKYRRRNKIVRTILLPTKILKKVIGEKSYNSLKNMFKHNCK